VRYPDGLIRVRPELDNFKRLPSIYIRSQVELTSDIRRRVMVAFNLLREWGPGLTVRYYSAYIDLPGVALIMYSPFVNWGQQADPTTNNFDYPPVRNSAPDRNPKRVNSWTEVYFDDKAAIWMLSTITPVDQEGQWIAIVAQDISIEGLVQRTMEQYGEGTYNLILDAEHQLIAHPKLMGKIHANNGHLAIDRIDDPVIQDFASVAYASTSWPSITESPDGDYLLGIARIAGPNWYFINVHPKALLKQNAFESARVILLAGLLVLVIEQLLLAWIVRRHIAKPLEQLQRSTQALDTGHLNPNRHDSGNDQLSKLSESFSHMSKTIRARDHALRGRALELEQTIREHLASEVARKRLSDRLSIAAEVTNLGIWEWDVATDAYFWDAQTFVLYGLEPFSQEPGMDSFLALILPADRERILIAFYQARDGSKSRHQVEYRVAWASGDIHYISCIFHASFDLEGKTSRLTGVMVDITERKMAEQRIVHMATHDPLTGLPNRLLVSERLQEVIVASEQNQTLSAVLFIDLDHFKQVNDNLGHRMGDELLKVVAKKFSTLMGDSDTLARMGGDEFVLLLPLLLRAEEATQMAQNIRAALAEVMEFAGVHFSITASIGISLYPTDGPDAETLLLNADIAMYRAKDLGRNNYEFYTSDLGEQAGEVLRLEVALREGIEQKEFVLFYQPKVSADGHEIVGAEALIRWNKAGLGLVSPGEFIPFAEERNLINEFDQYVLEEACRQLRSWIDQGIRVVPIAVNLSSLHFAREFLLAELQALQDRYNLPSYLLQLELTEGSLLQNSDIVRDNLIGLRRMGIHISLDDFGTGYSSLSYLHRFPIDQIKIDQSFVGELTGADESSAMVSAIVSIGHSLNLKVIAEGVETKDQALLLKRLGCEELQGYYFSRPVPATEFVALLGQGLEL
jgi:diguanylate cyclase (GGDEF)-like protein